MSRCTKCRGEGRVRSVACDHEGCYGDCGRTIECSKCRGSGEVGVLSPEKQLLRIEGIIKETETDVANRGGAVEDIAAIRQVGYRRIMALIEANRSTAGA